MMTRTRIIQRRTRQNFIFSAAHQQSCPSPAAAASRRRGNDLGTTIKYLRKATSAAAGIGLGTMIKYLRRTTGAAAGKVLGTTTCAAPRATAGRNDQVPSTHNERRRGQRPAHHDK
jgi:hypothetical protein